jgi:hypothetical protein
MIQDRRNIEAFPASATADELVAFWNRQRDQWMDCARRMKTAAETPTGRALFHDYKNALAVCVRFAREANRAARQFAQEGR